MSRILLIAVAMTLLSSAPLVRAQDDDVSLGDLARAARQAKSSDDQKVIDNDNLSVVMEKAESERLNGKPVFSIDPSGKSFRMTSPDGTCSLSFDAKATALISTPYVASELPQDQLLKLDGPAAIHDGVLEVSLHNGSDWELKEIVVGVTVPQSPSSATLKPALVTTSDAPAQQKLPDLTMIYHLRATASPDSNALFRGTLSADLDPGNEWHWSLVSARGIPPAAPGSVAEPSTMPSVSLSQTSGSSQTPYPNSAARAYSDANTDTSVSVPSPVNAPPPIATSQH
jgi:hypothetical protein